MISTPTFVTMSDLDEIALIGLQMRLDHALQVARNCSGSTPLILDAKPRDPAKARKIKRHVTNYGPAVGEPVTPANATATVYVTSEHDRHSTDTVMLVIQGTERTHAISLSEPVALDLSNAIPPNAKASALVEMVERWKGWLDRAILSTDTAAIKESDRLIQRHLHAIFEIVVRSEPAYADQQIFFTTVAGSPFDLPQIFVTGIGSDTFTEPRPLLTHEGQIALAPLFPVALKIEVSTYSRPMRFTVAPRSFGGDWMSSNLTQSDVDKLVSDLELRDLRSLVNRLPRSRLAA